MPYKHNEPRRHKIPKAKYKVSNWREYDQALQQRGSLTVWVTPEALEAWAPAKTGQRGRPTSYSDIVIETAVMLRLAMGKPWRQTEGMLRSIIQMLGLDLPVPDHTTLSRRSARLSLTTTLKKPKGPVNVVIDSSGLKIFGAGEWLHEKHGGKPRRSWRRLHLAVDPDSSDILAAELTTTDEGDASLVGPLLDQIDGPVSAVLADGAYDGDPTYQTILERHPDADGRHPAPIKRGPERHRRDRAHSARPAHRVACGERPDGLAGRDWLWQAGSRGNGFPSVQDFDRPEPPGPDSVRAEGRGQDRLQGDQPHDQPRHADLPEGRLNTGTEGEVCPQRDLCPKPSDAAGTHGPKSGLQCHPLYRAWKNPPWQSSPRSVPAD